MDTGLISSTITAIRPFLAMLRDFVVKFSEAYGILILIGLVLLGGWQLAKAIDQRRVVLWQSTLIISVLILLVLMLA